MKKRILAILLVAATLATMVVIPAYAADVSAADYNNTPDTCPCGCGEAWSNITWTDMPTGTTDSSTWAASDGSHYRLVGNLTLGSDVTCGFGVGSDANGTANKWTATFDLNGFTMTHTGTASKERVLFETRSGCTLNIVDTSANSTGKAVTSAPNGLWNRNDLGKAANKAYMNVYGGTFALSKNVASQINNGGLIRNETSCELTLNGGVFDASEYDYDETGGTIYSKGPVVTSNAYIIGGNVTRGGAIWCDKAVEITNNTYIKGGTAEDRGSAIYASSSLLLDGSTIEGSVYNDGGSIYVEGVLKVTELDLTAGTTAISTNKSTHAWSKLLAGSKIGVKAALDTAFGTGFTSEAQAKQYAAYFESAVDGAAVCVNANNELVLSNVGIYGVDASGNKTAYATVAEAQADGKTVYLEVAGLKEITLSGDAVVNLKGNNVTINGNGNKVTLFDSANADYETYGQVTLVDAELENTESYPAPDGKTYYTVLDNGQYSFHLLDAKLSSVALKEATGGLYYYATFMCDDLMAANVQYFGIKYELYDAEGVNVVGDKTIYGVVDGKLLTEEGDTGNKVEIALGTMNDIVSGKYNEKSGLSTEEMGKLKINATPFACVYGELNANSEPNLDTDVVAFGTEQFKSLYEIFAGVNALCADSTYAALGAQMYQLLFVDWNKYDLDGWREEFTNFAPVA